MSDKWPRLMCKVALITFGLLSLLIFLAIHYKFMKVNSMPRPHNTKFHRSPKYLFRFGAYGSDSEPAYLHPMIRYRVTSDKPLLQTTSTMTKQQKRAKNALRYNQDQTTYLNLNRTTAMGPPSVTSTTMLNSTAALNTTVKTKKQMRAPTSGAIIPFRHSGISYPTLSQTSVTPDRANDSKDPLPLDTNTARKRRSASGSSPRIDKNMNFNIHPKVIVEYVDPADKRDPAQQSVHARELRRRALIRRIRVVKRALEIHRRLRLKSNSKRTVLGPIQLPRPPSEEEPRRIENFGPTQSRHISGVSQHQHIQMSNDTVSQPSSFLPTLQPPLASSADVPQRPLRNNGLIHRLSTRPGLRRRPPVDVPIPPTSRAGIKTHPPAKLNPRKRISWPGATSQSSWSNLALDAPAPAETADSSCQAARVTPYQRMSAPAAILQYPSGDSLPPPTGIEQQAPATSGNDQPASTSGESSAPNNVTETTLAQTQTGQNLPGSSNALNMPSSSTYVNLRSLILKRSKRRQFTQLQKEQQKKFHKLRLKLLGH